MYRYVVHYVWRQRREGMAMEYPGAYGSWSGNPEGSPPDFSKCAASVGGRGRFFDSRQCPYIAKFDPDENGKPTACGKHRDKANAAIDVLDEVAAEIAAAEQQVMPANRCGTTQK